MSLCSWKLHLSPAVLLHLLLLLLFAESTLTEPAESEVLVNPAIQLNTTQGISCSTGCNNVTLTNGPNPEDSLKNISSIGEKNLSSVSDSSPTAPVVLTDFTSVNRGSEEDDDVTPNRTQQVQFTHSTSPSINLTTVSNLSSVTTVSQSKQSTAGPTPPSNHQQEIPDPQPPSEPEPGPATAPTTTAPPFIGPVPPTTSFPSTPYVTPTPSPPSAPPSTHPSAPPSTSADPSAAPSTPPSASSTTLAPAIMTTNTKTTLSSPLRTPTPTVRTTSVTSKATVTGNATSATVGPATKVSVVEVAGSALTRQLVDTAALLAVLVFGLLFFLASVAVFITQAYESYRTKDYTQVDYLINGMYTDSGV